MLIHSILLIVVLPSGYADKSILPVFMIDQDRAISHVTMDPNPFDKISPSKFANIIHESIKHSDSIIIFIEDNFSVEDLSIKDLKGTPYINLRQSVQDERAKYFPAVIEPYKLLTQIFPPQHNNVFYLKPRSKLELIRSFKYIYIFFQDGLNETRVDVLRKHDTIIRDVCFMIRKMKTGPLIAFYTGIENPVVVKKIHFVPIKPIPVPKDLGIMILSSGALFRFSGVYVTTPIRRSLFNQLPMISKESWSRRSLSTKMAYTDFELEFHFTFEEDRWILDNVSLLEAGEEVGRTKLGVGAPWNMSFVCGEPLVIVNTRDGSSVSISQYQIQPRIKKYRRDDQESESDSSSEDSSAEQSSGPENPNANTSPASDTFNFGKSVNCGPYFNIPILSSLLVTFLFLGILSFGIVFMVNIHTNSKYEDPTSKPLVHPES